MLPAIAALALISCGGPEPSPGPIVGPVKGNTDQPSRTEYFITPDGDFDDWNQIPADELAQSVSPADAYYPTGKKVMAYAGDTYLNLYVEYRDEAATPVQIMHLYIDADNDPMTGMGNPAWTNDGADLLFEGELFDEGGSFLGYDPTVFGWVGENLSGGWDWEEVVSAGLGFCKISDPVELANGNKAFEMTVLRSAVPGLGKVFRMGVALQYDWNDIAFLPSGSAVNSNGTLQHGPVENLLLGTGQSSSPVEPIEARITVDGDLSDWDDVTTGCEAPEGSFYTVAKRMKVTADENYVFLYVEYDTTTENPSIFTVYIDSDMAFDSDGNATTGKGAWTFENDGTDVMIQGSIVDETGAAGWSWAEVFMYSGTPMGDEWSWTSVLAGGSGATANCAPVDLGDGRSAFEASFMRIGIPGMGQEIEIGIDLQANWNPVGILPCGVSPEAGGHGKAGKLRILLP